MNFLKLIGAVSAAEHERLIEAARGEEAATIKSYRDERDNANKKIVRLVSSLAEQSKEIDGLRDDVAAAEKAFDEMSTKFKQAVADLAKSREEVTAHKDGIAVLKEMTAQDAEPIAALRPDAEAMRAKRTRDREQKAERRAKGPRIVKDPTSGHTNMNGD